MTQEISVVEKNPASLKPADPLRQGVNALAGVICSENFPRGDLAALRRIQPGKTCPPAFWRLLFGRVPEQLQHPDHERQWAVVMQGLAIMAPEAHDPVRSLGRVLGEEQRSESTESRLMRLLRSRGDRLDDQLRLMSRLLASKRLAVDWVSLARLIFARDDKEWEHACQRLARDYFRHGKRQSDRQD